MLHVPIKGMIKHLPYLVENKKIPIIKENNMQICKEEILTFKENKKD